ncbi:unnamed protein product, partial [Allacma fusca]
LEAPHKFAYEIVANNSDIPNQLKSVELICMTVVFGSLPFFQIIGIILGWMNSHSFVNFLNKWSNFKLSNSDFQVALGSRDKQTRNLSFTSASLC